MENRQESAFVPMGNDTDSSMIIIDKSQAVFPRKKKRSGPLNFFRVAMQVLRFRTGKSKSTQVQAASALRNVVGSMRPLHLQSHPEPSFVNEPRPTEHVIFPESFEASYTPFMSPGTQGDGSSWASPSASTASRYASANDLLQLARKESQFDDVDEESEEEEEEDKYYDDKSGDDMIDSKADAFIASFYAQMRDQRVNHHRANNNER